MKKIAGVLLLLAIALNVSQAQSGKVRQATKKREKQERLEQRMYEKKRKEVLKYRFKIQTEEVQERMKETRKKSELYNKKGREPFYKNIFDRKKRKKRKR